ncbi:hypothetical protein Tco_0741838 [Tanacetum coccineum]
MNRGNTHGAGKSSDPIFALTRIPSTPSTATSYPPNAVEVLQKSFEELKEARARDKELFEEAKEENRKQYEEKLKSHALTMKEEMVKEANAKIAEMFAQYTQQLPIPHSPFLVLQEKVEQTPFDCVPPQGIRPARPQIYAGIQHTCKRSTMGKSCSQRKMIGFLNEDGHMTCERLRPDVPTYISETSATREYPSLIHTFFLTHTVGDVFLNPEDKVLYDEMLRLQGLGSNTPMGVPYIEDEIMAIVRGGKQRGHIPGVGRVLPGQGTVIPPPSPSQSTHSADIARLKKREKRLTKQVNMFMRLFRSDDKFSHMFNQLESQPEYGGGSGSGGFGDDEPGDDEDGGKDEEDEDDS